MECVEMGGSKTKNFSAYEAILHDVYVNGETVFVTCGLSVLNDSK